MVEPVTVSSRSNFKSLIPTREVFLIETSVFFWNEIVQSVPTTIPYGVRFFTVSVSICSNNLESRYGSKYIAQQQHHVFVVCLYIISVGSP